MDITSLPSYVKSACFLTDSIALDTEMIESLELDIDMSMFPHIEDDYFREEKNEFTVNNQYVLFPKGRSKSLVSNLYKNNQSIIAQDVLEFLSSDELELTAEIKSKSFRISAGSYIKLIKLCFEDNLSLVNVVRRLYIENIKDFISQLEEKLEIKNDKKDFLLDELDDWVNESSPQDVYKLPFSYLKSEGDEEMIKSEYILAKEYLNRKLKEKLDDEAYKIYKEQVENKLDLKGGIEEYSFIDQMNQQEYFSLVERKGQVKLKFDRFITINGDWSSENLYMEFFDDLDHGEEIRSAIIECFEVDDIFENKENGHIDFYSHPFQEIYLVLK